MTGKVRGKDVLALQTAVVCVGLSGVFLGVFVLLAGGQSRLIPVICMVAGACVVVLGLIRGLSAAVSRPGRIFAYWALAAFLVLELMIPLNYASARRHLAFDWTEGNIRSLSDRTMNVLTRVEKPLRVTTFFIQRHPLQGPVFNVVRDLLEQYRKANRNIVIEHVDPSRETERMLALQKQMDLEDLSDMASVVLQYGEARKDVPMWRLLPRQPPGTPPRGAQPQQYAFHGEEEFTSAILQVTEKMRKQLYFTTNHGELSLDRELAEVTGRLRRDNYAVVKFDKLEQGVPDNCTVLLVVGPDPRAQFNDREQAAVARYLVTGGKLFYAVGGGTATGLEPVIGDFGINIGRNIIIDTSSGRATLAVPVKPTGYHNIINNLREYALRLDMARSVEAMQAQPGMMGKQYRRAYNLLETGKSCWAETDIEGLVAQKPPSYEARSDKRGPLGVAAVYEQAARTPYGQELPKDRPRTRIVAVGAGDFMIGKQFSIFYEAPLEGNQQFFFNAVNWLAEKEELISIPPKRFDFRPMDELDASEAKVIFWVATVGMPVFFLVLGGVIWLVRRGS